MKIGFIGQGWVGKNYANSFENRGFEIVRYSLESEYKGNKDKIGECDFVFIAVPTPTDKNGFDLSKLEQSLKLIKTVAIIKSTILPGSTKKLQGLFKDIIIVHSPEFLVEDSAANDVANPERNIIGIPIENDTYDGVAKKILSILPKAPFELICKSEEAEIIKYSHNIHGYMQVIFSNILYELAQSFNSDWENIKKAILADPMMSHYYLNPIHKNGRGAGGNCFIKDFAAFRMIYESSVKDKLGLDFLRSMEVKNIDLLIASNKNIDILNKTYDKQVIDNYTKGR